VPNLRFAGAQLNVVRRPRCFERRRFATERAGIMTATARDLSIGSLVI
jgi:hypothetical protein